MSTESTTTDLDKQISPEIQELAKSAKTISSTDPRVKSSKPEDRSHQQYRNNFSLNFIALQRLVRSQLHPDDIIAGPYLENFTKAGIQPEIFYEHNRELCEEIFHALDETYDYDVLLRAFADFYRDKKYDVGDRLSEMVPHPLGIEAVGMYAWDKLNPLFEKADQVLIRMGVNTEEFGR